MPSTSIYPHNPAHFILTIRDQRVILDVDLAQLYGVPTKALNQAVKRNKERFPKPFLFQLTQQEVESLKFQIETSSPDQGIRSQIVTASKNVKLHTCATNERKVKERK
jgi:hypothetical protein